MPLPYPNPSPKPTPKTYAQAANPTHFVKRKGEQHAPLKPLSKRVPPKVSSNVPHPHNTPQKAPRNLHYFTRTLHHSASPRAPTHQLPSLDPASHPDYHGGSQLLKHAPVASSIFVKIP